MSGFPLGAARMAVLWGVIAGLAGCEAPLVLDAVEQAAQAPVRRTDNLQAVAAFQQTIVAAGTGGVIVVSPDSGASWRRHEFDSWPSFLDVASCADGLFAALAFEGEVWLSSDGGASWRPSRLSTDEAPQAISCDPAGNLWVVGSFSTVSVSRDRGASWTASSRDEDVIYTDIQFFDGQTAYIVGEFGAFLKTADGGASWTAMPPMPGEFYPQGMHFENPQRGWVAGLGGVVLATRDGGLSWQAQSAGTLATLYTVTQVGGHVFVSGGEGSLFRLEGGGWTPVEHGQPFRLYLRGLHPIAEDKLVVSGPGGALHVFALQALLDEAA